MSDDLEEDFDAPEISGLIELVGMSKKEDVDIRLITVEQDREGLYDIGVSFNSSKTRRSHSFFFEVLLDFSELETDNIMIRLRDAVNVEKLMSAVTKSIFNNAKFTFTFVKGKSLTKSYVEVDVRIGNYSEKTQLEMYEVESYFNILD